jgi:hypothetical protein
MLTIPVRAKVFAATGVLCVGLGAAAINGAFAAPSDATALAATTPTPAAQTAAPKPKAIPPGGARFRGPGFTAPIAQFLGMSDADLHTALMNGQTLAQIAQAHGKSAADLKTFLTNELKTRLDKAVSDGKITSQQETTMLNNATARFDQLINATLQRPGPGPGRGFRGGWAGGPYQSTIAKALGMSEADVRTELMNGKTYAQIAQEHGKTAADLENAIITSLKPHLDSLMNTNFKDLQSRRAARGQNGGGKTAPTATPAKS